MIGDQRQNEAGGTPRKRRRSQRRLILMIFLSALALAANPAVASAAEAWVGAGQLHYYADPGEFNNVTISGPDIRNGYTVAETGRRSDGLLLTVTAGSGCTALTNTKVRCTARGVTELFANVGDLDDFATASSATDAIFYGSNGWDTLTGGPGADQLYGEAGSDGLYGNGGNDVLVGGPDSSPVPITDDDLLDGGPGNDNLYGGFGNDTLIGGPRFAGSVSDDDLLSGGSGFDTADYSARTASVHVTVDGVADDGWNDPYLDGQLEHDNVVPDVERVFGGSGNDTLIGNDASNWLTGGAGDDVLGGRGGNDFLNGDAGSDEVAGETGDDHLDGGTGGDWVYGYLGNDVIESRDGFRDNISCSGDTDTLTADTLDVYTLDCENVTVG
jgi:Ca2+-binding RTX toxin-like protein